MPNFNLSSLRHTRLTRVVATAALAAPLSLAAQLQQVTASPADSPVSSTPAAANVLEASLHQPLDLSLPAADVISSSSSSSSSEALPDGPVSLMANPGDGMQPPPYRRRRYGRPSYNDRWHNADGSNRLAFVAGGGFNVPVGSASSDYLKTSWRFEAGAGINFSKKLAVILQFDYDKFGLPGNVLTNQKALYTSLGFVDSNDDPVDFSSLDGNSHIWSFTANPTLTFYQGDSVGAYAVVGGGFYHKVTNFTLPQVGVGYDYYYGPYEYVVNQVFDHYTSNSAGVTGGLGVTYKFSRFANQKLFAEARYIHTFNSARAGDPTFDGSGTPYNLYPPNSNETSYIPVTVGIRF